MSDIPITISRLKDTPGAYNWVMSSWLTAYFDTYRHRILRRPITYEERTAFYAGYHPYVTKLVADNTCLIATLRSDPDTFAGWACGSDGELHYAYTKRGPYRRDGIATRLIESVAGKSGFYMFPSLRNEVMRAFDRRGWMFSPHKSPLESNDESATADDSERTGNQVAQEGRAATDAGNHGPEAATER